MAAFTHLCSKVNISIAHNTLTIYRKTEPVQIDSRKFYYANAFPRSVFKVDLHHDLFHDDGFKRENEHYHLEFPIKIDEIALDDILTDLINQKVITKAERQSFLTDYAIAVKGAFDKFDRELINLKHKSDYLAGKALTNPTKYKRAADAAFILQDTLNKEANAYKLNRSQQTYELFKTNARDAIRVARPILAEHRGYKKIVINLAAAIFGLVLPYLIAASVNYYLTKGEHFFFHMNTDSVDKIEQYAAAQSALIRQ